MGRGDRELTRSRARPRGWPWAVDLGQVLAHEGKVLGGDTGDVACDHYHRSAETSDPRGPRRGHYRFSIAWPRIQPDGRGAVTPRASNLQPSRRPALDRDIQPWVTLYHWDLPQALEDGRWPARTPRTASSSTPPPSTSSCATGSPTGRRSNEPWCSSLLGYSAGVHAPDATRRRRRSPRWHHLLIGHGLAVQAMREVAPTRRTASRSTSTPWTGNRQRGRRRRSPRIAASTTAVHRPRPPRELPQDVSTTSTRRESRRTPTAAGRRPRADSTSWTSGRQTTTPAWSSAPAPRTASASRRRGWAAPTSSGARGVPVTPWGGRRPDACTRCCPASTAGTARRRSTSRERGRLRRRARASGVGARTRRASSTSTGTFAPRTAPSSRRGLRGYFVWSCDGQLRVGPGLQQRFGARHATTPRCKRTPKAIARWYAGVPGATASGA